MRMEVRLPDGLAAVVGALAADGGRPVLVGGCVRDWSFGVEPKDIDIEVHGMATGPMEGVLRRFGDVVSAGRSFGVLKLKLAGREFDFSVPRRDNKVGAGHRGFRVEEDPGMGFAEAASRRDFTINAMMLDPVSGELIDPFGGMADLESRVLRHVGPAFAEDPLRVLRGMQFACRFDMTVAPETAALSRPLLASYGELPSERVWGEWEKWATLSTRPELMFDYLEATAWEHAYPAIADMRDVPQNPTWHPEGCVHTHTTHVVAAAGQIAERENLAGDDKAVLLLAALFHDCGKPFTTIIRAGEYGSPDHAMVGRHWADIWMYQMGVPARISERVLPLVAEHMFPVWDNFSRSSVRRLKERLGKATIDELLLLMEADRRGRPPKQYEETEGMARLRACNVELPPKAVPILMGRHLIERGMATGPEMGRLLKAALEAQLDEEFEDLDGALRWLDTARKEERCPKS